MTTTERARAYRKALRAARTLASELLSLGTLPASVRLAVELDKSALLLMVGSASGYIRAVEDAAEERRVGRASREAMGGG